MKTIGFLGNGYRIVKMFLWFPKTINDDTRWFKFVKIKQRALITSSQHGWIDIEWYDDNKEPESRKGQPLFYLIKKGVYASG